MIIGGSGAPVPGTISSARYHLLCQVSSPVPGIISRTAVSRVLLRNKARTKDSNNGTVQQWYVELHLGTHNSSVLVTAEPFAAGDHTGCPLLSARNKKKLIVQRARDHQHWTIEVWKNISWSNMLLAESGFGVLQRESSLAPSCLVSTEQAGGCG